MRTKNIEKFIKGLETRKYTFLYLILTAISIIFLRIFLEIFSSQKGQITDFSRFFFHFPLSWISIIISISLALHFITREKIDVILKLIIIFLPLILIVPIVDILSGGYEINYIQNIGEFINFFKNFSFLTFERVYGITYGIRVEVLLVIFLSSLYVFIKTKKAYKTVTSAILISILISLYGTMTAWFKLLNIINEQKSFIAAYTFLISLQIFFIFLLSYKDKFIEFLKDQRHVILLHYLLMVFFGFWLGIVAIPYKVNWIDLFLLNLAVFFGWLFSVSVNDIFDVNKRTSEYGKIAFVSFLMSISIALILGYIFFLFVLVCASISFIYSAPPLKLKRYPIISTLLLALISLIIVFMGFMSSVYDIILFPTEIIYLILVTITLAFNVKDINDVKEDRLDGVWTFPVIFGQEKGKTLISTLILISYILVPFILFLPSLLIISLIFGSINFFIINKKKPTVSVLLFLYFVYFLISFLIYSV